MGQPSFVGVHDRERNLAFCHDRFSRRRPSKLDNKVFPLFPIVINVEKYRLFVAFARDKLEEVVDALHDNGQILLNKTRVAMNEERSMVVLRVNIEGVIGESEALNKLFNEYFPAFHE